MTTIARTKLYLAKPWPVFCVTAHIQKVAFQTLLKYYDIEGGIGTKHVIIHLYLP